MFGKEKTFQEITGFTEDEFKSKVAELDQIKASQAAKDAELAETRSGLDQIKAELSALQSKQAAPVDGQKKPASFYEDADAAFNDRIAPFAEHTLRTSAELAELKSRQKFSREYQLWGDEIEKMVSAHTNLADKGNPALYENIVNIVKGKHMGEILEAERKGQSLFVESGSSSNVGSSTSDTTHGLSKDQLDAAKRLGMTAEEFSTNYNAVLESRGQRVGHA
jgi:hypothetical protein